MNKSRQLSIFRKVALSLWNQNGDPSVYSFIDLDVSDLKHKSELLTYVVKALGVTMERNSELHSLIRWGQIELRKDKSISVMVNIPGQNRNDLSALNLENVHEMTIQDIQGQINLKAQKIRDKKDPHLGPMLNLIRFIPRPLLKTFLKMYEFLIYEFGTRLGMSFLPYKPFGSIIVSNVGSLGIQNALLPLVPMARATMMVSVGKIFKSPRCIENTICARDIVQLGITFDHRLFDGSHASKMLSDFEKAFYSSL